MLNKEVCKQCCRLYRSGACHDVGWWDENDEKSWRLGFVLCPSYFYSGTMQVRQPLKRICGYYMEQLVLGQEGKPE